MGYVCPQCEQEANQGIDPARLAYDSSAVRCPRHGRKAVWRSADPDPRPLPGPFPAQEERKASHGRYARR